MQTRKARNKKVKKTAKNTKQIAQNNDGDDGNVPLFVFYDFKNGAEWEWIDGPKGWWWVGGGHTTPICLRNCGPKRAVKYIRESQFSGPPGSRDIMRARLKKQLDTLKKKGIVTRYKILNRFDQEAAYF